MDREELRQLYRSVRTFDGRLFILDGTSEQFDTLNRIAKSERRGGRRARVTWVGNRGILDNQGNRRKNCYALWVCWE